MRTTFSWLHSLDLGHLEEAFQQQGIFTLEDVEGRMGELVRSLGHLIIVIIIIIIIVIIIIIIIIIVIIISHHHHHHSLQSNPS